MILGAFGPTEIILVLAVVLLMFGGKKIPELMKGLGQGIKEFKDASKGSKPSMAPLQFGIFYSFEPVCEKIDLKKWFDKPFLDDDEIDKLELQLSLF